MHIFLGLLGHAFTMNFSFRELVEWDAIAVVVHSKQLPKAPATIQNYTQEQVEEMRHNIHRLQHLWTMPGICQYIVEYVLRHEKAIPAMLEDVEFDGRCCRPFTRSIDFMN